MDCRARGRCCPEAGKDLAAVEAAAAAPGQERPWPAGTAGGALFGARPPWPCRCSARRGRGGRGWELGVGVAAGAPWPPWWREAERGEKVLNRTPASASRTPHARSRGDKGTLRARGMEMVLGKRATPSWGGAPRGRSSKDPHPQRTHTHLLGDQLGSLRRFQLLAGARRARPRTYVHAYIHRYICAHRHTSRTPAPTGAPSLAQNPLQPLPAQQHGHTTCGLSEQPITTGCDIWTH